MKNVDENAPETHSFNDLGRRKTQLLADLGHWKPQKPLSTDYVRRKPQNLLTPISFGKNRKTPPFVIPPTPHRFN